MCGHDGTPSLEQQAQELDTPPQVPDGRFGSRPMPGFKPPIPLEVLNCPSPKELSENALSMMLENLNQITFLAAYQNIHTAAKNPASNVAQEWAKLRSEIDSATTTLQQALAAWEQETRETPDAWIGATKNTAMQNLTSSLNTIATISAGAGALSTAAGAFNNAIHDTYQAIVGQYPAYLAATNSGSTHKNAIEYAFNRYAQSVMTNIYSPNMQEADNALNQAAFPTATPQVSSPAITNVGSGGSGFTGGAGGGGLGGAGALGPVGDPSPSVTPNGTDLTSQDTSQTPAASQTPTTADSATDPSAAATSPTSSDVGSQLGSQLGNLASPLQGLSSLGQGANAAQQGNTGALGGPNGPGKLPPEGKLDGLGKGGGLKGGAGGIGGGAGAIGKAAGAPATAAGRTVATGARAGLSGAPGGIGAGAPAAGAPGAGQQGAGAHGAPHQPSKALRRKRNGEEIIGDAEAVVPVLGEPAKAEAAKPDAT